MATKLFLKMKTVQYTYDRAGKTIVKSEANKDCDGLKISYATRKMFYVKIWQCSELAR